MRPVRAGRAIELRLQARHHVAVDLAHARLGELHDLADLAHREAFVVVHQDDQALLLGEATSIISSASRCWIVSTGSTDLRSARISTFSISFSSSPSSHFSDSEKIVLAFASELVGLELARA
jgi:hypothetical protein